MKCPVCGAKLKFSTCPYCRDVTEERILNASNKEAKKQFKLKNREAVVYSTVIPSDLNKRKLQLLVTLLNWCGVGDWYAGKKYKALFHIIPVSLTSIITLISVLSDYWGGGFESVYQNLVSVPAFLTAIGVVIWFFDLINVLVGKYKVPVVLPEVKTLNKTEKIKIKK